MYWTELRIGLLILLILVFITGVPLVTWCVVTIRRDWRRAYITKRRRVLVITSLILGSIFQFIYIPQSIADDFANDEKTLNLVNSIKLFIVAFIVLPVYSLIMSLTVVRLWLLYFDMRLNNYLKNKNWREAIEASVSSRSSVVTPRTRKDSTGDIVMNQDDDIDNVNNNRAGHARSFSFRSSQVKMKREDSNLDWTVTQQKKIGNGNYMFKITLCISIIESLLELGLSITIAEIVGTGLLAIFTLLKAFSICYIWKLINKLGLEYSYDSLGIRKEILRLLIFFLCVPIIGMGLTILRSVTNDHYLAILLYNYWGLLATSIYIYLGVPMMKQLSLTTTRLKSTQSMSLFASQF